MTKTTDHPLTVARTAELWDGVPESVYVHGFEEADRDIQDHTTAAMRAAYDADREHEREHTDPHHDPRPWQDCTHEDIRAGDPVEARPGDILYVGVAHHKDSRGDWCTEDGYPLTNGDFWPLRRIPAATPPAEVVELPGMPCVLTDVRLRGALATGVALWTGLEVVVAGFDGRAVTHPAQDLAAFTLPDGTRARRDGEREDGTPRFVKTLDGDA